MRGWIWLILLATACEDGRPAADAGPPDAAPPDAWLPPPPDDIIECVAPDAPFTWPVALAPVDVPSHESWRETIDATPYMNDPFASTATVGVPWVKFVVMLAEPTKVIFFDSNAYPFHHDFAVERIPAFAGLSAQELAARTLYVNGQEAVLGVAYLPWNVDELGIQLVLHDDFHPELIATLLENVAARVTPAGKPWVWIVDDRQAVCLAGAQGDWFAARGISVGRPDRWQEGDGCYVPGWAIGRLVSLAPDELDAALLDGRLLPDDILLIDGAVPAEVPAVAAILTTAPSSTASHVAILSRSSGIPFLYLRRPEALAEAASLVGRQVVVKSVLGSTITREWCNVDFIDVEEVDSALRAEIAALVAPPPIAIEPVRAAGTLAMGMDEIGVDDVGLVGGKAVGLSTLTIAVPEQAPSPALALTFDAWNAFRAGGLGDEIAARLAAHPWGSSLAALDAELAEIRNLVEDTPFPDDLAAELLAALAPFDPQMRLRFRSSTNVEDGADFTGAGLYDSETGCLADDLDDDDAGPSACNPWQPDERGVLRAIHKVYASFYRRNAVFERMKRGVDEAEVGMALLVHPSTPDAIEAANGVALVTATVGGPGSAVTLVTQLGAVSVANPDGTASPEVVTIGSAWESPVLETPSSLVPLGAMVMNPEDYPALADLIRQAGHTWRSQHGVPDAENVLLDLEYKKLTSGAFVIKQIRPVAAPPTADPRPLFLVGAPLESCTHQGRTWSVFETHASKARVRLDPADRWLDADGLATSIFDDVRVDVVEGPTVVSYAGAPGSFPGAAHTGEVVEGIEHTTDSWMGGTATWELLMGAWVFEQAAHCPVIDTAALHFTIRSVAAADGFDASSALGETCPEDAVVDDRWIRQDRSFTTPSGAATVETGYWWPPNLTGNLLGGFTYPLGKWDTTTITGLTTSPIVLTDYWSQTYGPDIHNFNERFLFEPRLDPGVDATTLAELEAQDIRAVVVGRDTWNDTEEYWLVGLDGTIRPWD